MQRFSITIEVESDVPIHAEDVLNTMRVGVEALIVAPGPDVLVDPTKITVVSALDL